MAEPAAPDYQSLAMFTDRLRRTQAELAGQGVDWLAVGPSADLRYLLGSEGHLIERLSLLLLPREGDPAYVVAGLEAALLEPLRDLLEIHPWEETQDPAAIVAAVVRAGPGGDAPTVAVADELLGVFLLRLQAALPAATWREGGLLLRPLRAVKDGREVELLREAARRTDAAWEAFIARALSGQTERQALARLLELTHATGLEPGFGHCSSGPFTASPLYAGGDRMIGPGDVVVFDWGGRLEGYHSDVTRTVVVGEPEAEFARAYEAVLAANEAALQAVAPGVACETIDLAARAVLEDAGYEAYILHRVGHGLGLSIHEEPYLVTGNAQPLQSGMVFSDEPGVYLPGRWGIRIEDAVLCTDTGGERLNEAPRELTRVG